MSRRDIIVIWAILTIVFWLGFATGALSAEPLLEWGPVEPDTTYRIYVSRTPGAQAGHAYDFGTDHRAELPALSPGEPLWFCVTAIRAGLESECSNEVGFIKPFVRISPIAGGVQFYFHRMPEAPGNFRYTLEVSEDLKEWTDQLPVEPKTAEKNGVIVEWIEVSHEVSPHLFARVRVEAGP